MNIAQKKVRILKLKRRLRGYSFFTPNFISIDHRATQLQGEKRKIDRSRRVTLQ